MALIIMKDLSTLIINKIQCYFQHNNIWKMVVS